MYQVQLRAVVWPGSGPKPAQGHVPVLVGAGGTEKTFTWIAANADGWITTPNDTEIDGQVLTLQEIWAEAGRRGKPEIVVLGQRPDPERLAHLESLGVTEAAFGLPDKDEDEVVAYLGRLVGRLGLA